MQYGGILKKFLWSLKAKSSMTTESLAESVRESQQLQDLQGVSSHVEQSGPGDDLPPCPSLPHGLRPQHDGREATGQVITDPPDHSSDACPSYMDSAGAAGGAIPKSILKRAGGFTPGQEVDLEQESRIECVMKTQPKDHCRNFNIPGISGVQDYMPAHSLDVLPNLRRRVSSNGGTEVRPQASNKSKAAITKDTKIEPIVKNGMTAGGNKKYKVAGGQEYIKCDFCDRCDNVKTLPKHMKAEHSEQLRLLQVASQGACVSTGEWAETPEPVSNITHHVRTPNTGAPINLRPGEVINMNVRGENRDLIVIQWMIPDGGAYYNHFYLEDRLTSE